MARLTSGRSTSIEHPLARPRFEQVGRELSRSILHGHEPFVESWKLGDIQRPLQAQGFIAEQTGRDVDPARFEIATVLRRRDLATVDSNPERRPCVVRIVNMLVVAGPIRMKQPY